jgi:iron complex outermembrane receptor protein
LTGDTDLGTFTGVLSGYKRRFNRVQDGTYDQRSELERHAHGQQRRRWSCRAQCAVLGRPDLSNKIDQTSLELRLTSKDYDPKRRQPVHLDRAASTCRTH